MSNAEQRVTEMLENMIKRPAMYFSSVYSMTECISSMMSVKYGYDFAFYQLMCDSIFRDFIEKTKIENKYSVHIYSQNPFFMFCKANNIETIIELTKFNKNYSINDLVECLTNFYKYYDNLMFL